MKLEKIQENPALKSRFRISRFCTSQRSSQGFGHRLRALGWLWQRRLRQVLHTGAWRLEQVGDGWIVFMEEQEKWQCVKTLYPW